MTIEYMNPGELIPYRKNAKLHPADQVDHIANSIKMFGWTQPIVVDENLAIKAPFHTENFDTKHTIVIEPKMSFGTVI